MSNEDNVSDSGAPTPLEVANRSPLPSEQTENQAGADVPETVPEADGEQARHQEDTKENKKSREDALSAIKADSRKWERRAKSNKQARDQLDQLMAVLNPGDDKPDPQDLAQKLEKSQRDAETAQTELQVYQTASKFGLDADRVLDSRKAMRAITESDGDLDTVLQSLRKDAPHLMARTGRYISEHSGGTDSPETDPAKLAELSDRRSGLHLY